MWSQYSPAEGVDARRAQASGSALGDVTTIVCLFCKASVHFAGLPAIRYTDHLFKEHNIMFDVEAVVDRTLSLQKMGHKVKPKHDACRGCPSPKLTLDVASQADLGRCSPLRLLPSASPKGEETKTSRLEESPTRPFGSNPDDDGHQDVKVPIAQMQLPQSIKQSLVLPWFAGCEYECQMCHLVFYYVEDLRDHVIRSHCPADDYLDQFEQFETKSVSLKCQLCSNMVKRNYSAFRNHLENCHGTSLANYETQFKPRSYKVPHAKVVDGPDSEGSFLSDGRQPVVKLPAPSHVKKARPEASVIKPKISRQETVHEEESRAKRQNCEESYESRTEPDLRIAQECVASNPSGHWKCVLCEALIENTESAISHHLESVHSVSIDIYRDVLDSSKRARVVLDAKTRAAIDEEHASDAGSSDYSEWKKGTCSFECALCSHQSFHSKTFWNHVHRKHALGRLEYVAAHGQPKGAVNKFACPICFKVMLHEPFAMSKHARSAHGLSLNMLFHKVRGDDKGKASQGKTKKAKESGAFKQWKRSFYHRCHICQMRFPFFKKALVYAHAKEAHGLSESQFGPVVVDKHSCRACGRAITRLANCLSNHAKGEHKLTLAQYFSTYIDGKKSDSAKVNPSTKPNRHEKGRYVPWADQCVYSCRICQKDIRNYKTFASHLGQMHSKKLSDYKAEFGEFMSAKRTHSCALCGRSVLHSAAALGSHLHGAHNLTVEQYHRDHVLAQQPEIAARSESEPGVGLEVRISQWIRRCSYRCEECAAFECVDRAAFKRHVRDCHELAPSQYTAKHGQLECVKEFLRCAFCHEDVLRDEAIFGKHCAKLHQSSLEEYFHRFVANAEFSDDEVDYTAMDDNDDEAITFDLPLSHDEDLLDQEPERDHQVEEVLDDEWMHGCTFMCKICDEKLLSRKTFRSHLAEAHEMDSASYERLHGDPMTIMSMFKCACCGTLLMRDGEDIELHLRLEHEMTLAEYHLQFVATAPVMPTIVSCSSVRDSDVTEADSLNWNRCVRVCRVCHKSCSCTSSLKCHLRQMHNLTLTEHALRPDPGQDVVRQHTCQLCFANVTFEFKPVRDHLASVHKLSLSEYQKLFESHLRAEFSEESGRRDTNDKMNTLVLNSKEINEALQIKKESEHGREEILRD